MASTRDDGVPILRPIAKRGWQLTPMSTEPPTPRSPSTDPTAATATSPQTLEADKPPPRSRSILNLTSSTLFGIYSNTQSSTSGSLGQTGGDVGSPRDDISQPSTPWGATTPQTPWSPATPLSASQAAGIAAGLRAWEGWDKTRSGNTGTDTKSGVVHGRERLQLKGRTWPETLATAARNAAVLFLLGVAYGAVVTRLHGEALVSPGLRVDAVDRHDPEHLLAFWGCAGAALGFALPWLDAVWSRALGGAGVRDAGKEDDERRTSWMTVLRGVGAFVGIAFAIRRLPWESTLQATATLALSNPVLWYLIDRSFTGLVLSIAVCCFGTAAVLGYDPAYVPAPTIGAAAVASNASAAASASDLLGALAEPELLTVATWVASVLFYCCVCFGNIGRMLAVR